MLSKHEKLFHGWRIARAGLLIQMVHSGLVFNAFSLFAAQLCRDPRRY